jgi:uncharacterized membrane protein (UPF0127 family)
MRYLSIIILILLIQCTRAEEERTIEIQGIVIKVEVADSPGERAKGLSDRDTLPPDRGVLFVFPDEARRVFWMYHCNFDIDLAYIDEYGIIREIITMEKEPFNRPLDSLKKYISNSSKIRFVLETNGGWFEKNNIHVGNQIDLHSFYAIH